MQCVPAIRMSRIVVIGAVFKIVESSEADFGCLLRLCFSSNSQISNCRLTLSVAHHLAHTRACCLENSESAPFYALFELCSNRMVWQMSRQDPPEFCCPISLQLMEDPVLASDGHAYERAEIEQWFASNSRSPVTGQVLG